MNIDFNSWWNEDDLTTQGNPFADSTPAYWAWEGWCAGVKAEREACAKLCESLWCIDGQHSANEFAAEVRARNNT